MSKCQLKGCESEMDAEHHANENIGDGYFRVSICETCKFILGIQEDGDLPVDADLKIQAVYQADPDSL